MNPPHYECGALPVELQRRASNQIAVSGVACNRADRLYRSATPQRKRLLRISRSTAAFAAAVRALNVTSHIAPNTTRRSAIDRRTTRHPGYATGQRLRERIEEEFGWMKTSGFRKTRHRGTARVGWLFRLTAAACNLVRLPKLLEVT